MKYILMDYVHEAGWSQLTKAEQEHWLGAYNCLHGGNDKGGRPEGPAAPSTATTVRVANGKTQVLYGPYADSKEQLGSFRIIEVADLDAANSWASLSPTAIHGIVEEEYKGEETCGN